MENNRVIGIDSAKGFGILAMLLIHAFIQQIAHYDGSLFVPIVQSMNPLLLIPLIPIAILSLMGPFFTLLTCVNITIQMIRIKEDPKLLLNYVKKRILSGFLIVILGQIITKIVNAGFWETKQIFFPEFPIRYAADTLDSIAWSGVIVSIILYLIFKFVKSIDFTKLFATFLSLTVFWLVISPIFINLTEQLLPILRENEIFLLEFILSKFALGRFKLFQTLAYGWTGVIYGLFLFYKIPIKKINLFTFTSFFITLIVFIIAILLDATFLENFASEDVPLALQVVTLGSSFFLISYYLSTCDFGKEENQLKFRKRTTWLRRFGIVSLTAFILGTTFADIIYSLFEMIWGSSVGGTLENPTLEWNFFVILLFIFTVYVFWEILIRLWEKFNYKFSVEWIIAKIIGKISNSKKTWIDSSKILYEPYKDGSTEGIKSIEEEKK